MRVRRLHHSILLAALFAVLIAATLPLIPPVRAAMPSPGDECTDEGASMWGGTSFLTCDGSAWHDALEYEPGGKLLFRLNDDTSECDSTLAGRIRFNAGDAIFEGCDGNNWAGLAGGGTLDTSECQDSEQILFNASTGNAECPFDHLPDAFSFSDEDGAELSTEMQSNIVQILNIDDGVEVSVSGDGSPEYRICDDSSCSADPAYTSSAGTIDDGQYIQLRLTSSADHETISTIALSIGSSEDQWLVTTKSSTPIVADVFSIDLYTGNGGSQTINNGINLAGQGGMVWIKSRSTAYGHMIHDAVRGAGNAVYTNNTNKNSYDISGVSAFNSNGFSVGSLNPVNANSLADTYVAWTFREAPKFFDIVTYTGDGTAGREIAHDLGVAPGMIITKRLDSSSNGEVWHRSLPDQVTEPTPHPYTLRLESANGLIANDALDPSTSTSLVIGRESGFANISGATYVAYLFAHDEGDDGVIQCGSYIGNGSSIGPTVNLGWEPQWVMVKRATGGTAGWYLIDAQRSENAFLMAHASNAETSRSPPGYIDIQSSGFQVTITGDGFNGSGSAYIYCAIRDGGA